MDVKKLEQKRLFCLALYFVGLLFEAAGVFAMKEKRVPGIILCCLGIALWILASAWAKRQYQTACDEIVKRRNEMTARLAAFPFLKPYPSQANYILCAVEGMNSKELANTLLRDDDILIKDLSAKNGFGGRDFIRIAVRDEADNDALYRALAKIRA